MIRKVLTGTSDGKAQSEPYWNHADCPDSQQAVRMEHPLVLPGLKYVEDEH